MSDKNQFTSICNVLLAAWQATINVRLKFFTFIILFILAYSADLLTPWAIGYTLDIFVQQGLNHNTYQIGILGIAAYVGLKLIHITLHHIARYLQIGVAYHARMNMLNKVFAALLDYPLNWHTKNHSGDSLSKLNRSAGAIEGCIGTYVWQVIEGLVKVVFAGIAIFALDYWVAINVLVTSLLTILLVVILNKRLTIRIRRTHVFWDNLNRILVDNFFSIVTVKILNIEDKAKTRLSQQTDEGYKYLRKIAKYGELKWGSTGLGYTLVIGTSLLIYFYHIADEKTAFEVGKVYVLINYLDRIFQAIGSFTGYYSGIIEAGAAYEDAHNILLDSTESQLQKSYNPLPKDWQTLDIKSLTYFYNSNSESGLKDINLSINRGDKIALVGPSGGGKSTLLKIMAGIIAAEPYRLTINQSNQINMGVLNKSCLLIPQEPEIFSDSLHYNVTLNDPISESDLDNALQLGCLKELLEKLPSGWDTNLAQKGLNISVGEKQRVALVRGLLRANNKELLLLDEPTSSLDPNSEKLIFTTLLEQYKNTTIITACHRLSIVPMFDKIILIKNGAIVEFGSFDELVKSSGEFASIWKQYQEGIITPNKANAVEF